MIQHNKFKASVPSKPNINKVVTQPQPPTPNFGKILPTTNVVEERSTSPNASYERLDLPSKYVPYAFESLHIRKLSLLDQAKIVRAQRSQNITVMLDALDATISEDIRKLMPEDFKAICYWHRINSYIGVPLNVSWTTIYGRPQSAKLKQENVKYITTYCVLSRQDYLDDKAKGFILPNMGDLEALEQLNDEDKVYLFEKAQFIDLEPLASAIAELTAKGSRSPTVDARIAKVQELSETMGLTIAQDIHDYASKYSFDIREDMTVSDSDITWLEAIDLLPKRLTLFEDKDLLPEEIELRDTIATEYERIKGIDPSQFIPKKETHTLPFSVWGFFPAV